MRIRLSPFQKILLINCNRFKQTAKARCDPKAIQQINFTGNLDRVEDSRMSFVIEEARETASDFSKGTVKVLWFYFCFDIVLI